MMIMVMMMMVVVMVMVMMVMVMMIMVMIQERNVAVQQDTYRQARTIHSKWTRHQAFASEIDSNEERLEKVQQSGQVRLG